MTSQEVRARYVDTMGEGLGELFHVISSELTWIHWRWIQYRILFGDNPSRIPLLNETAPFFFRVVHDVFFAETLLGIARIVGPPESLGRQNLTIQRFPSLITESRLQAEVDDLVEKAKTAAKFVVDWRNRRLAHRDLDVSLNRNAQALAPATRSDVENSLSALRDVLNRIERHYCNANTLYDSVHALGDAKSLLHFLENGVTFERDKLAWLKRGEFGASKGKE